MEHKKKLDELHQQSLESAESWVNKKSNLSDKDKEKVDAAKKEWQAAWDKFLVTLMYLETLEL
jgi:hypothetical protein